MTTTTGTTTPDAFSRAASRALITIARTQKTLTADDVWAKIPTTTRPADPRALGAVMTTMAKAGHIKATRTTRKSTRRNSYTRVWRSQLFGK